MTRGKQQCPPCVHNTGVLNDPGHAYVLITVDTSLAIYQINTLIETFNHLTTQL